MVSPMKIGGPSATGSAFGAAVSDTSNTAAAPPPTTTNPHFADTKAVEEMTAQRFLEVTRNKIAKANLVMNSYGSIADQAHVDAYFGLAQTLSKTHCSTILFAEGDTINGGRLTDIAKRGAFSAHHNNGNEGVQVSTVPHATSLPLALRPHYFVVACVGLVGLDDDSIVRGQGGVITFSKPEMVLPLWLVDCSPVKRNEKICVGDADVKVTMAPVLRQYSMEDVERISQVSGRAILPAVTSGGARRGTKSHKKSH